MASPQRTQGSTERDGLGGLDDRIHAAEQALIARDERVRRGAARIQKRLQRALDPRRGMTPALGLLLLTTLGGGLWRRLHRRGQPLGMGAQPTHPEAGTLPDFLLRLLPLAWPLLPPPWRARFSPATAATALGLVMPLLARLRQGQPSPSAPPLTTVAQVDLKRYAGQWYEMARLPSLFERRCPGQPQADYRLTGGVIAVRHQCRLQGGRTEVAHGIARVHPCSGNAKLELSFLPAWLRWLPLAWTPYWILHLDEEAADYRVALVGSPDRQHLWLLCRHPVMRPSELHGLIAKAAQLGFRVERLRMVQPDPGDEPSPR